MALERLAGPSVQTILARRRSTGAVLPGGEFMTRAGEIEQGAKFVLFGL
jgi:hypothetical protein